MKSGKLITLALTALILCGTVRTQGELSTNAERLSQLESQVAREPGNVQLIQQLGWLYFYQARQGDDRAIDKAVTAFERGYTLDPKNRSIGRGLGMAYFLKTAILARSRAERSSVLATLKRTLSAFDRALEQAPDDPLLLSSHGSALTILSGFTREPDTLQKGIAEMNRAVRLEPKGIHARLFRAFTHLNLPAAVRDQEATLEDLNTILKGLPEGYNERAQGAMHVLLGDVYSEANDAAKAKSHYVIAAGLPTPAADEARNRLASLEKGTSDTQAVARYRANINSCSMCHTN